MKREENRPRQPKVETINLETSHSPEMTNTDDLDNLKMQHMELIQLQKHLQKNLFVIEK